MGNKHFMIKYSVETGSYYIKDTGEGTGTFIKIDKSLVLQHGYIISYGNCSMFVIITPGKELQLKFVDGPKLDQILYFFSIYYKYSTFSPRTKLIKIGRTPDCDIRIDNKTLSRYQCGLYFSEKGWIIVDGDGTQESKNGTWYFDQNYMKKAFCG